MTHRAGLGGSPTFLVDGVDPFPVGDGTSWACRLYRTEAGLQGAPSVAQLEGDAPMTRTERFTFPGSTGDQLAARLDLPEEQPRAYALFAHCFTCSKDVVAASRISRRLVDKGFGVLRFDFTGLGSSGGDFANTSSSSNVEDLVAAAHALSRSHAAPRLLVGHSLGGAAVLAAAPALPSVTAVATIGAPFDPGHIRHLFPEETLAGLRTDGRAQVTLAGRTFTVGAGLLEDPDSHHLEAPCGNSAAPSWCCTHRPTNRSTSTTPAGSSRRPGTPRASSASTVPTTS